ncbi:uncharacterized protein PAE49_021856 isoform 1-T2 [Odontesthes bonariensis]|uniref:uncharacterized protein LOC142368654 n=1 Tax=Odontesthes bonariensis TaxID=219752 RepID=UPI003F58C68C
MLMENTNEMLQAAEKQMHDHKIQSADNKSMNYSSNKANNKNKWMKLTGTAAGALGEVFLGSNVVVLQGIAGGGATADAQTGEEYSVKVGVYDGLMTGQEAEEGEPKVTEKGATSTVVAQRAPPRIILPGTPGTQKCIKVLKAYRVVILGAKGAGKSSLGNSIFGENVFKISQAFTLSGASECQVESKSIHWRRITLVDTPGFSDAQRAEQELKEEIMRGITECAPGPHAFLIVLKVEKSPELQQIAIDNIYDFFPEEAFKYAAVVFTHGDQIPEGMITEEFVQQNECVCDLVKKCSGRYHFVDNRCNQKGDSNKLQMTQLLHILDKIVMENKGACYTIKMLQAEKREKGNKRSVRHLLQGETDNKANNSVCKSVWIKLSGPAGDTVAEAFLGAAAGVTQNGDTSANAKDTGEEREEERGEEEEKEAKDEEEKGTKGDKAVKEGEEKRTKEGTGAAGAGATGATAGATGAAAGAAAGAIGAAAGVAGAAAGAIGAAAGAAAGAIGAGAIGAAAGVAGAATGAAAGAIGAGATGAATGAAAGATSAATGAAAGATGAGAGATGAATGAGATGAGATGAGATGAGATGAGATGAGATGAGATGAGATGAGATGAGATGAGATGAGATGVGATGAGATGAAGAAAGLRATGVAAVVAAGVWELSKIIPKIKNLWEKIKQVFDFYKVLKENFKVILLVVVFCLLLVLSFCVRVPFVGTILLSCGVLVMFLVIVYLILLF